MRTKRYFSKKWIIINYLLVIVIPSCILGLLALRGIEMARHLLSGSIKKLAESNSIISETNSRIAIFNDKFRGEIHDLSPSFPSSLTFEEHTLNSFIERTV